MKFDYCLMGDASSLSEPLAVGPLLMAGKFIMLGDDVIEGPQVKSPISDRRGFGLSLFKRLCLANPQAVTHLGKSYTMPS